MGELKFIGSLLMASLFAIAIISFVTNYGIDNDATVQLGDDPDISALSSTTSTQVETFSVVDTNGSSAAFYESTIKSGDEVMEGGGQFKVGFGTLLTSIYEILTLIRNKIFGGSTAFGIFLTALGGFMVYTGIRYIYKTWVGKNPD